MIQPGYLKLGLRWLKFERKDGMGQLIRQNREHRLKRARNAFKTFLVKYTKCELQDGWPCGTCTCNFLAKLGVKEDKKHNRPMNRINEIWRGILQMRGIK